MNEMLVAVFDTEDDAIKGMRTIEKLHQEGGISLYASALIVKDRDGRISVKQHSAEALLGTALGLLMGGIVGILGGPAGSAVGASLGGYLGLLADWASHGVDLKFLDDVSKTLTTGKAAVLAEIEESWTSMIELRLKEHNGIVFRRFRTDFIEDQLLQQSAALQKALEDLQDELDKANAANQESLQSTILGLKHQLKTVQDQTKATIDLKKEEMDLKVKVLLRQLETATHEAKTRIKKRIADVQAEFDEHSKK
jgi:uncharacterized membrane protein/ribosomal protein L29